MSIVHTRWPLFETLSSCLQTIIEASLAHHTHVDAGFLRFRIRGQALQCHLNVFFRVSQIPARFSVVGLWYGISYYRDDARQWCIPLQKRTTAGRLESPWNSKTLIRV